MDGWMDGWHVYMDGWMDGMYVRMYARTDYMSVVRIVCPFRYAAAYNGRMEACNLLVRHGAHLGYRVRA